jgi:hypothetical protein
VLKAAPRNPSFTIDGLPLGADSSSLGGSLAESGGGGRRRVEGSAAQLYAVVDRTGEPSKRRLSTRLREEIRRDNKLHEFKGTWMPAQLAQQAVNQAVKAGRPSLC